MSTLYIRLPSRAVADSVPDWLALGFPFALVSNAGAIERQGTTPFPELAAPTAKAQQVAVLLAASDASIFWLKVPPLSAARLKAALPNLVEEQLLCDPADCVIVSGPLSDGLRPIAVAQRAWIEKVISALLAFGARNISVVPAQLCLPCQTDQPGGVTAAIDDRNDPFQKTIVDMTLRVSEQTGIGLAISPVPDHSGEPEQNMSAVQEVIKTLLAAVAQAPITLYVPQPWLRAYQETVNESAGLAERIRVSADNWSRWIDGAKSATIDLMAGLGTATGQAINWRPWRWSLVLAVAVLLINASALNIGWWRMKSESHALRTTLFQIYKSAYPKESVILDPIAQMQQKIAIAKHNSGQAAPDDFTALTAAFAEAWAGAVAASGKSTAISALEYHDHTLLVHLKAGGEVPTTQMQAALAKRNLSLSPASPDSANGQSGAVVWQIRSTK